MKKSSNLDQKQEKKNRRYVIRRGTCSKKNLFEKEVGQNNVLFGFQLGQTANGQTATVSSTMLSTSRRKIFGLLPTSGSIENQTDSDSYLLPHLAYFVAHFIGCPCFCFAKS